MSQAENDRAERANRSSPSTGPSGLREARINYRALESEG